jgi:hypothetical protein
MSIFVYKLHSEQEITIDKHRNPSLFTKENLRELGDDHIPPKTRYRCRCDPEPTGDKELDHEWSMYNFRNYIGASNAYKKLNWQFFDKTTLLY